MAIQTITPEYQIQAPQSSHFVAVGLVAPEAATLVPEKPFSILYEGALSDARKFGRGFDVSAIDIDNRPLNENQILEAAIQNMMNRGRRFSAAFKETIEELDGPYSLIAKRHADNPENEELILARSRSGNARLFVGQVAAGGFVASTQESAIAGHDPIGLFEMQPGTLARISTVAGKTAMTSYSRWAPQRLTLL